jgi:predicted secreted protein
VESGLSVAVSVRGEDPQDPPEALYLFMPRNPEPWGLEAHFQAPALPELATRIRLSATQNLTAVGRWADGRLGLDSVTVLVTRGACIDENYGQWVR